METPTGEKKPKLSKGMKGCLGCLGIVVIVIISGAIIESLFGIKPSAPSSPIATASSLGVNGNTFIIINQYPNLADDLNGSDSSNQPTLKNFTYDSQNNNIQIEFRISSNLTESMAVDSMHHKVAQVYYDIYKGEPKPLNFVTIRVDDQLTDQYGNTSWQNVYTTSLDQQTASKINWSDNETDLVDTIIPHLWTVTNNFKNEY